MLGKTILSMLLLALERQTMVSFLFDVFKERLLLHLLVELVVRLNKSVLVFLKPFLVLLFFFL